MDSTKAGFFLILINSFESRYQCKGLHCPHYKDEEIENLEDHVAVRD